MVTGTPQEALWMLRAQSGDREAFKRLKRERLWFEQVRDQDVLDALPAESTPAPAIDADDLARLIVELSSWFRWSCT